MPVPSDMDNDPNSPQIQWEVVIGVALDGAAPTQAQLAPFAARIASRTHTTPKAVALDGQGGITVTMPDTGADLSFWVGWIASALVGIGRTGIVVGRGTQARVTA